MIEKNLDFYYGDNNSEVLTFVNNNLVKTAEYSKELEDFIANKLIPKKGKTYALVNALSAGEYYGSNRNGDYFPAEVLKQYHKTFEEHGYVYKHHINKDPNKALGKVIFSHYNDKMHRVELIIELDNDKAKEVIDDLLCGKLPKVSMGCKVPYDVCSICGNKAKSRAEYCNHLKTQMNLVLSNGKKVYAINTLPTFFDLSIVTIPADQTASILARINKEPLEEIVGEEKVAFLNNNNYIKTAELQNTAAIKKNIDFYLEPLPENLLRLVENKIQRDKIFKLASYPLNEVLSTFLVLRIFPAKDDFQKLVLYSVGLKELADKLEEDNVIFEVSEENNIELEDVHCDNFNKDIIEIILDDLNDLSLTKPLVVSRSLVKIALLNSAYSPVQPQPEKSLIKRIFFDTDVEPKLTPHKNPIIPLSILGGLYYSYAKLFNDPSKSGFKEFVVKYPWIIPLIVGAGTIGSIAVQNNIFEKTAGTISWTLRNSLLTLPVSYIYAGAQENKAMRGEPISGFQNFVRKHPALTGIVTAFLGAKGQKYLRNALNKTAELVNNFDEKQLEIIYNDLKYMEVQ